MSRGKGATIACIVVAALAGVSTPGRGEPGFTFVKIPSGAFVMGSRAGERNERPEHRVTLSGFDLQDTETTQAQWVSVMGTNPSYFKGEERPVDSVSWHDVQEFIGRLNTRQSENIYRLPTEAEWEYASRAGSPPDTAADAGKLGFHTGNSLLHSHPVRTKPANAWGLFDMRGNVWEWVGDWYGLYSARSAIDPRGPANGTLRVMRGGGWHSTEEALRATFRLASEPVFRNSALGFRLARTAR